MPYTPREASRLLDLLVDRGTLPFDEVLAVYADANGRIQRARVRQQLHFLWVESVFTLLDASGQPASWDEDAAFEAPSDFTLRLDGFDGRERNTASLQADRLDPRDISEVSPGYAWAYPQRRSELRIVGDVAEAAVAAERLRVFTQRVALDLVAGRHARLPARFSARAPTGHGLEALLDRLARLEKEYGAFEAFDRVEVSLVFCGGAPVPARHLREDFPRDVPDADLRGESAFQVISVATPNGLPVHEMTVHLRVVDEGGVLRIVHAACVSGL